MSITSYDDVSWERMSNAVDRVRARLLKTARVLDAAGVAYLEALVRMKLTSFRDKDRVHLRDLIGVGLIDAGWVTRVPAPLRDRLQAVLDDPDG